VGGGTREWGGKNRRAERTAAESPQKRVKRNPKTIFEEKGARGKKRKSTVEKGKEFKVRRRRVEKSNNLEIWAYLRQKLGTEA